MRCHLAAGLSVNSYADMYEDSKSHQYNIATMCSIYQITYCAVFAGMHAQQTSSAAGTWKVICLISMVVRLFNTLCALLPNSDGLIVISACKVWYWYSSESWNWKFINSTCRQRHSNDIVTVRFYWSYCSYRLKYRLFSGLALRVMGVFRCKSTMAEVNTFSIAT